MARTGGASLTTTGISVRRHRHVRADAAWSVQASSEQLSASVREVVSGVDVTPGVYGAVVRVTRRRRMADGTTRDFDYRSNESPFVIAPRIHSSVNTLTFAVPGEADPRTVTVRPAQIPIGGAVRFEGSGLAGDRTALLLTNAAWTTPVEADAAWSVQASSEQLSASVREVVSGVDVAPGVYGAVVRVTRRRRMADGTTRDFDYRSNESPFVIAPRIDTVSPPDGAGQVVVTGRIFQHASLPDEAVQVYVSTARLVSGLAGALGLGEFAVDSPTQLTLRLPAGLIGGQLLALRIFVNGAEAAPNWIVAP